jgi:hypothetical protein
MNVSNSVSGPQIHVLQVTNMWHYTVVYELTIRSHVHCTEHYYVALGLEVSHFVFTVSLLCL